MQVERKNCAFLLLGAVYEEHLSVFVWKLLNPFPLHLTKYSIPD
jgi:hypothetical protein